MRSDLGIKMEVEVSRQSPTRFRTFSIHLFDYLLFLVVSIGLLFAYQPLLSKAGPCQNAWSTRDTIQEESGLYVKKDGRLINVGDYHSSSSETYATTIDALSGVLDDYFHLYFSASEWDKAASTYHEKLLAAKSSSGESMFDEYGERILTNPDYDKDYASFFISLAKDYAPGFLNYKAGYAEARSTIVRFFFYSIELSFFTSYLLFFLLFPLLFHRGKQTLGMKLTKVFLVDAHALSPSLGKYLGYRLFNYVFFIVIAPFALLIPYFISATMIFVRKERQSLFEYVFGFFPIEAKKEDVYESEDEALENN
ncbi:MAG: RDD family protein [Bacilli bacterium]|nr:RDD family protein [Bacilli bacterium]